MIGKRVSHYQILELVGEGGMGAVYKAKDVNLDRIVALKFFPFYLALNDDRKKRFIREAKIISTCEHPNIDSLKSLKSQLVFSCMISLIFQQNPSLVF